MAGGKERILRRRIKSVESTKKITRAMELIAASRIVKAQQRVKAARPYSEALTDIIASLSSGGADLNDPLLNERAQIQKVAFVVITADRGLAGGYNSSVIRAAERALRKERTHGRDYALVVLGHKAEGYFRFRHYDIDAAFTGMSERPTYDDAKKVATAVTSPFVAGTYDIVNLVYTEFITAGTQRVKVERLMPVDPGSLSSTSNNEGPKPGYEFEPAPAELLSQLLPRYVEAKIYGAMLDAAASEHAARQRAMKSATDNAEDLITSLRRVMNRARQDSITTEIMEIVGGAEALRQSAGDDDYLPNQLGNLHDLLPDDFDRRVRTSHDRN